jgi:hypothetical protein
MAGIIISVTADILEHLQSPFLAAVSFDSAFCIMNLLRKLPSGRCSEIAVSEPAGNLVISSELGDNIIIWKFKYLRLED